MSESEFSLRAQADEIKLRGNETVDQIAKLRGKGRAKEMLALMDMRVEILRAAWRTLDLLARAEEAERAALPPAATDRPAELAPPAEPPKPEVDEWGDPIERK